MKQILTSFLAAYTLTNGQTEVPGTTSAPGTTGPRTVPNGIIPPPVLPEIPALPINIPPDSNIINIPCNTILLFCTTYN